jgi:hypothetical protein
VTQADFLNPDNFQHHVSVIAAADRQEVSAHSMTVVTQQVMEGDAEDNFNDGHKAWDSVPPGQITRPTSIESA